MNFLDSVLPVKKKEVKRLQERQRSNRFAKLFEHRTETIFVAEIKPRSPSAGQLITCDPITLLPEFEAGGAHAISVLTDEQFFGGSTELFSRVRNATSLPLLRKEFIIDESQLIESLLLGADAVLLITQLLTAQRLTELIAFTKALGLVAVVEIVNDSELALALESKAEYIGVNSRDLKTLQVDQGNALQVLRSIPAHIHTFFFSGVENTAQVQAAIKAGAKGLLVGTSLIRAENPPEKLKELILATKDRPIC